MAPKPSATWSSDSYERAIGGYDVEAVVVDTSAGALNARDVLKLRAWARAYLWHAGEYSLHEAVDVLQHDAARDGLIKAVGQDGVQAILAAAFQPFHDTQEQTADHLAMAQCATDAISLESKQTQRRRTPRTTVEAILYCVRTRGISALKQAANLDRLSHCDPAARTQINKRIASLIEKGMLP
jgi:hypothetical protein